MNINDVMNGDDLSKETIQNVSRETLGSERKGLPFLKVESLDKPIEDYYNHPFNKSHDEDLAFGLRGIEAYLGNTNLAIIDLLHLVKYLFKKVPKLPKKEVSEDGQS